MVQRIGILTLTIGALLVPAARADAPGLLKGKTSQHKRVVLRIGAAQVPSRMLFDWGAKCKSGTSTFTQPTQYTALERKGPSSLADEGTYNASDHGYRFHIFVAIRGHKSSAHRWKGTFRGAARIYKKGKVIDYCRVRGITWSVTR